MKEKHVSVTVSVTKEHIDKGKRMCGTECMVHRALRGILRSASMKWVCPLGIFNVSGPGIDYWSEKPVFKNPVRVFEKMVDFDRGYPVKPFKFKMRVSERHLKKYVLEALAA